MWNIVFYSTMTDFIEFSELPPNGLVKINMSQNPSSLKPLIGNNTTEITIPVDKEGTKTIVKIGEYHQPIYTSVQFYNSSKILTANQ